ncbi:glycosyl transferase, group 1 [Novosphingobium aromaticivorans DSM 12444]|uniref:Glycosyl transferase, group 1 n=1 Tax=Novosphingobium aromaticivorans (strain ATCC 700278 / DSM 12444 / CCUG 56034 / CIP 105152 / NBRC 16084 / F199) TaxID=279238 RepID=Q2GAD1_NOVAD|nr:glycosyltransferase family 1 protein [Novosphingobium aromaticivorans]ABD25192.1 glycosyl transferase, group 1 [Novosphingobium aromaticivorans DSM 12444]SCX86233.1 Glycosyltransferase involved in cell wall bisynthesis [Novosphingobium aromaticivorans]
MISREFLLDVSRLVWRNWSHRLATGIDRVCYAYLRNFGPRSQAVVQYRGVARILTERHSDELFETLLEPDEVFRRRLSLLAPRALAASARAVDGRGTFYINVGHTDIDLSRLLGWTRRSRVNPIYLIHDLIPLTHSEFCRSEAIERHRGRVVNALFSAAGVIANSRATAAELELYGRSHGIPLPPITSAWLAGARLAQDDVVPLKSGRHFVCVGTIEGRKNHFMLLQVWQRLVERLGPAAPKLVLIGQKGAEAAHVESMLERGRGMSDHVVILSHCPDEELGRWIRTARALLLPSFAEGFGLPVIEAMELGTPVIASDLPCFREIGVGIPTLLDPLDAVAWERTILSFLDLCPERARQLRMLKEYSAPTWGGHFAQVESWLEELRTVRRPFMFHPGPDRRSTPVVVRRDGAERHAPDRLQTSRPER